MKSLNGPQSSALMQLINWIFRPLEFLEECSSKYGDIFNLKMKLVLAKILTEWDLSLTSDRAILPKRRGGTIAPDNGVPLVLNGKRSKTKTDTAIAELSPQ